MKETLKKEMKMEWDSHRTDNNSPHVSGQEDHTHTQTTGSPQSVITSRKPVRTITTTGHITEGIAEIDPESPDSNSVTGNLSQGLHQQRNEQHEQIQQRGYQEEQQHYVQISHPDIENSRRSAEQHVYATANGQVQVEVSDASNTTITLTVKEEPSR